MNGAESLVRTAAAAGLEICFANPGTTEMPLVAALDAVPGVRAVLGLFEGVCTGAADGYGRMADKPAATLLHLGPGLANGLANLHNARRARTPVVNWVGDHASWHLAADAPLTSDIASLARPMSSWVRITQTARELAADGAAAIQAASGPPGGVATLIVPVDCQWDPAGTLPTLPKPARPAAVDAAAVARAAEALGDGTCGALLLGGRALRERGLRAAARVAEATGATLLHETFFARLERGSGLPVCERLPYFPEQARERLASFETLVLVGTPEPVAFFGYPDQPSRLAPDACVRVRLEGENADAEEALEALAEQVGAKPKAQGAPDRRPEPPSGPLTPESLGRAVAALQPEGAIVVDEAATSGLPYFLNAAGAPPHSLLALTGGAIGQGLPCALGAALARPDRRVIALQADGSGMYTLQALWSLAREALDVVVVICANRSYRILQIELARTGVAEPGPQARSLMDLTHPALDWVALARGLGVPAASVERAEDLVRELRGALARPGPSLIEALL